MGGLQAVIQEQESLHLFDYWRVIRGRKEVVIAVFLMVVLTGVAITYAMDKVYMASVLIQVKEEAPDVPVFTQEYTRYDPLFLRTQFEIIQSAPVIEDVVRKRELDKKLAKAMGYDFLPPDKAFERTVKILSKSMRVQQYRDTNLIEIRVYLSEPKGQAPMEAALAANMFAQVYREQSMARSRRTSEAALKALQQSLEERRKAVDEALRKVDEIRQKYQLNVLSFAARSDSAIEKLSLTRLESARIQMRMELEDKKAKFEKVASLGPGDLLAAAPYVVGDPALQSLVQQKRDAEIALQNLTSSALGPNHPDVVRQREVIAAIDAKITEALKGLKTGLQHDYETALAKCKALETMLEETKANERTAEASAYAEFDKAVEELEHAKKIRDALEMRLLQEKIEQNVPRTTVEIIEMAKPPAEDEPVRPQIALNLALSILVGLVAGIGLAFFVEYIDTSIKTVEDVERYMKVPVMAVIPQKVKAFVERAAEGAHAEAYRMLRTNVQFSEKFKGGKTLCITSGSVAEGKSLTVFNLAYICAQHGDKVLIIDADLHRPRQHKILRVSNKIGLVNFLAGEVPLAEAIMTTEVPNLSLLASGRLQTSSIHGLLDTRRVRELLAEVRNHYDLIIMDAPPIIGVSDTSVLVRAVDGVVQIIQHRKYPRAVSNRAKDIIENLGGNLLGVVLNNINISKDYSYYYHYHYYYYPRREKKSGGNNADLTEFKLDAR